MSDTAALDSTPVSEEDDEYFFLESARKAQQRCEAEWRAENRVFAWIDHEPVVMPATYWRFLTPIPHPRDQNGQIRQPFFGSLLGCFAQG
jgi:hypothetical protein